jgi:two-component system, OmpR family, sensor histidine kinase KdpD
MQIAARLRKHSAEIARWLGAILVTAMASAVMVFLGAAATTAGMVYLVLVAWFASQAGISLSVLVTLICAVSFDYFFLEPIHTLRITGIQQWVAMLSFLASCVVVSRVAERARRQTRQAQQRQADVERLYALSQEMMLHDDTEALIHDLPRIIDRIFELQGVVLYVAEQNVSFASRSEFPGSLHATLRSMTLGPIPTIIDSDYQAIALMIGLRAVGALAWKPVSLSLEVSTAVSAQVGIVLARAIAVEASRRMAAAREGERLRAALIDSLTHELRTPLTSIRAASTTLLEAGGLDEAGRLDMAKIIDEEAARLDLLIGEAVEMAEIDANVVEIHLSPQHPRALLEQAVEESRKALASHHVSIEAEEPDEPAWFDSQLLSRVLRHLLENAAGHTQPDSRITLSSRRTDARLEFCVEDDGPGIEAKDLPLIFEKFYRGTRNEERGDGRADGHRKGSGMGLAITRAIITAHGGGIEATSTPGKGAKFCFWVPLVERELMTATP